MNQSLMGPPFWYQNSMEGSMPNKGPLPQKLRWRPFHLYWNFRLHDAMFPRVWKVHSNLQQVIPPKPLEHHEAGSTFQKQSGLQLPCKTISIKAQRKARVRNAKKSSRSAQDLQWGRVPVMNWKLEKVELKKVRANHQRNHKEGSSWDSPKIQRILPLPFLNVYVCELDS